MPSRVRKIQAGIRFDQLWPIGPIVIATLDAPIQSFGGYNLDNEQLLIIQQLWVAFGPLDT